MPSKIAPVTLIAWLLGALAGCSFGGMGGDWELSLDPDPTDCADFLQIDPFEPGEGGAADFSAHPPCFLCEGGDAIRVGLETSVDARIAPPDAELPQGATLSLLSGDSGVLQVVESSFIDEAPRCSSDASAIVRAVAPGDAMVHLVDGDGLVIDRYPVAVREVASIDLGPTPGTTAAVGEVPLSDGVVFLIATARSEDGLSVWTDGAMEWSVDDPGIVDFSDDGQGPLEPDFRGHIVMLSLRAEGTTTVRVRIGEIESTLEVTVTPPEPEAPTGT